MASISSLMGGSSSSSIYGTRNVISGLASGLDTESLIQNSVSGYETKITQLQQQVTKWEWKQESYRSMSSKMSSFLSNYTSFSSAKCMTSRSYFTNSVTTTAQGTHASKVSATGKTNSDVSLLGVKQLATAATYTTSGIALGGQLSGENGIVSAESNGSFSLSGDTKMGKLEGGMTLKYGTSEVTLEFDKTEQYASAEELAAAIEEKLKEATINVKDTDYKASEKISVSVSDDGTISFAAADSKDETKVSISETSGTLGDVLKIDTDLEEDEDPVTSFKVSDPSVLTTTGKTSEYLEGNTITITLDGVTKKIDLPSVEDGSTNQEFITALNNNIADAFGKNKLTVKNVSEGDDIQLQFTPNQVGSTFKVTAEESTVREAMALGDGVTNYMDTKATLKDLLGDDLSKYEAKDANGKVRTDDDGNTLYELKVNGESLTFTEDATLSDVMNEINSSDAGVTVNYSKTTNQFIFSSDETGATSDVDIEDGGLGEALFGGGTKKSGQDAIVTMEVNGVMMENVSRSTNTFEVDGLNLTLKGTFGYEEDNRVKADNGLYMPSDKDVVVLNGEKYVAGEDLFLNEDGHLVFADGSPMPNNITIVGEFIYKDAEGNTISADEATTGDRIKSTEAVTFTSSVNADALADDIKTMVAELNVMLEEVKKAYSTMPEKNSSGDNYEPLTDEDKADMSESSIKSYEEKAKAGLLFGDNDLSSFYYQVMDVFSQHVSELESIGISQSYKDGLTVLTVNEEKLTAALQNDAEGVADIFAGNGSEDGFMKAIQKPLEMYGKTEGTKGILVEKAGSTLAASTLYNNEIYNRIQDLNEEIAKWQDTISEKVDYYTSKFTYLEQLISEMNSQSSMISSLYAG